MFSLEAACDFKIRYLTHRNLPNSNPWNARSFSSFSINQSWYSGKWLRIHKTHFKYVTYVSGIGFNLTLMSFFYRNFKLQLKILNSAKNNTFTFVLQCLVKLTKHSSDRICFLIIIKIFKKTSVCYLKNSSPRP